MQALRPPVPHHLNASQPTPHRSPRFATAYVLVARSLPCGPVDPGATDPPTRRISWPPATSELSALPRP